MSRGAEWWQRRAPRWSTWRIVGVALCTLLAIGGLAVVGFYLSMVVAFAQWGSNK